jgi:hypothetical protein
VLQNQIFQQIFIKRYQSFGYRHSIDFKYFNEINVINKNLKFSVFKIFKYSFFFSVSLNVKAKPSTLLI